MLVLSRKKGQTIEFPELQIVVRVIGIRGTRVQLGIDAPDHFTVHRGEKVRKLEAEGFGGEPRLAREASEQESDRVLDELARLEAELSAVAELAEPCNRDIARQVAGEAIQRIEGINRSLRLTLRQRRSEVQPIADLVKVRAEVLERLRRQNEPAECCEAS